MTAPTTADDAYAYSPRMPSNVIQPLFMVKYDNVSSEPGIDAASWPKPEMAWDLDFQDRYDNYWEGW